MPPTSFMMVLVPAAMLAMPAGSADMQNGNVGGSQSSGCITDPFAHNPFLRGKFKIVKAAPCIGEVPSGSQESNGRPEVGSGCIADPFAHNPFLRGKFKIVKAAPCIGEVPSGSQESNGRPEVGSGCIADPFAHNPFLRGKFKIVKAAPCISEAPSGSQESNDRPEVGSGCIPDPFAHNPFLRGKFNLCSSPGSNGCSNGPVSPGGQAGQAGQSPKRPTTPSPPEPQQSQEHKRLINPPECGTISQPKDRIVGGKPTSIMQMPWMARLGYKELGTFAGNLTYKCGGSLINHRYVLTAAHCVFDITTRRILYPVAVLLGVWDVKSESDCETISDKRVCSPPTVLKSIARVLIHPQYDHRSRTSDIALVRLRSPVTFTDAVIPICLPGQGTVHVETSEGINATVAGWGGDGETASRILTHAELPLWSEDKCKKLTRFCAGGVIGVDSCNGDSGGPLLLSGQVHDKKRAVLIGVVSYGDRLCGTAPNPGSYTRIEIFMPWIACNLAP